ncbi:hypothetical protein GCM10023148_51750 [Actinokineospora soli]
MGVHAGAVALTGGDALLLATPSGFASLRGGTLSTVVEVPNPDRFNDGKCDPAGRFLAGTIAPEGEAALHRLDPDLTTTELLSGLTVSNGLAWSPDGATLYHADTPTHRIDAYAYDVASGSLGPRRSLVEIPDHQGAPDGMTVDADGCVWVALWGGGAVHRYTPDGRLDRRIETPVAKPSSVAFGGPGLTTLFITSAGGPSDPGNPLGGALFAVDPGVTGLPAHRFAGELP